MMRLKGTQRRSVFRVLWTCGLLFSFLNARAEKILSVESSAFDRKELLELQKALDLEVGKEINLKKINNAIHLLYEGENQQILFVDVVEQKSGVAVFIRGKRLRKLKGIKFNNVDKAVEEEISSLGIVRVGDKIDLAELSIVREKVKERYLAMGYPFVSVEAKLDEEDVLNVFVVPHTPTRVSKISFLGVAEKEAKELGAFLSLRKGEIYSKKSVEEALEELRKYFRADRHTTFRVEESDVKISEDRLGAEVFFKIQKGERYQFEFIGNQEIEEFELRNLIQDEKVSQVDAVSRMRQQIEMKYRRAGFHFVRVDTKIEAVPSLKVQKVQFQIDEGNRVIVDRIFFNGANGLKESELASLFFENAPGVLNRGLYWEEGLSNALLRLKQKLESLGFLSASLIGPRVVFSSDQKGVDLIFDADLGSQSRFRKFEIRGAEKIQAGELISRLPYKSGDLVSGERVEEIKKTILSEYRSRGYVDVFLEESRDRKDLELSEDQRSGDMLLTVKEGKQYFVGSITLEGNRRTKEKVIFREMLIHSGDEFDLSKVRQSEENIALLQLFSRVEIEVSPNVSDPFKKDLKVILVEIKPGSGEVGLGASYEEPRFRARSFLGLQYRNLGGLNQTVSQRTEVTLPLSHQQTLIPFIEYALIFGYQAPYPFALPFTFSAQAGLDAYELSPLGGESILQSRSRIEERVERRLSRRVTGIYRLHRYERTTLESLAKSPPEKVTNSIGSTGPGLIVDFRDDSFNPTKGSYHTFDLEFAHPYLLSETSISFIMMILRNSFYFSFSENMGLIFSIGGGYAKSLFDTPIPVARLANDLSLGGQGSLRGYSSKEYQPNVNYRTPTINPTESAFLNGRVEIVVPLLQDVNGAIFFDSGQLYPNMAPAGRKDGLGVGFRYKTPVGPVVIDIAHGFESREKNVKFTFTIGSI